MWSAAVFPVQTTTTYAADSETSGLIQLTYIHSQPTPLTHSTPSTTPQSQTVSSVPTICPNRV